tara:strand:+ start:363 stop:467 length:105 start_codon:yes stop_codon:yes gene_type:complete
MWKVMYVGLLGHWLAFFAKKLLKSGTNDFVILEN